MLQINDVAAYFAALDDNHWKCQQTGCIVGMGLLEAYRSWPAAGGLNGFTMLGLPLSNEAFPQAGIGVQRFERGALGWDTDPQLDKPPGALGPVYLAQLDRGPGQDPRVSRLQSPPSAR